MQNLNFNWFTRTIFVNPSYSDIDCCDLTKRGGKSRDTLIKQNIFFPFSVCTCRDQTLKMCFKGKFIWVKFDFFVYSKSRFSMEIYKVYYSIYIKFISLSLITTQSLTYKCIYVHIHIQLRDFLYLNVCTHMYRLYSTFINAVLL